MARSREAIDRARRRYEERQVAAGGRQIRVRLDAAAAADLDALVERHGSIPAAVAAALREATGGAQSRTDYQAMLAEVAEVLGQSALTAEDLDRLREEVVMALEKWRA